jgi:uncharacterized OB-fold protein
MVSSVDLMGDTPTLGTEALSIGVDGQPVLKGICCGHCGTRAVPPTPVCPNCASEDVALEEQPREGRLYSYTILHVAAPKWRRPLALGYVDLPNGVRVFTHLDGQHWSVGQEVKLAMGDLGSDQDGNPIRSFVFTSKGETR